MRYLLVFMSLLVGCADPPAALDAGAADAARGQALFDARVAVPDAAVMADAAPPVVGPGGCAAEEVCDGTDRDCDGQVDEGCGCDPAASACFAGPPAARGVGACQDGVRGCDANGELFGPCEGSVGPVEEVCQDEVDQDCDGRVDEGCPCVGGELEICGDGADDDCDGQADEGCGCGEEVCADQADNDCDGRFDEEPCRQPMGDEPCNPNLRRACFEENPARIGVGPCAAGVQVCDAAGRWGACEGQVLPTDELCDTGVDENCDGNVDECIVEVAVVLDGDCLTVSCPPEAPFPVACDIQMSGNDERGCVASRPDQSEVYFQEGDACGAGRVRGSLSCSNVVGQGLNEQNCQINKRVRFYPPDRRGCPDT